MNNAFLKLIVLGGVGYLIYKYYYLPKQEQEKFLQSKDIESIKDGRTVFYGETKKDYVRGFPLPKKITDIKKDTIWVLIKPNEQVLGQNERGLIQVQVLKDMNRLAYTTPKKESFIADYDEIKNKLVMNQDYTK